MLRLISQIAILFDICGGVRRYSIPSCMQCKIGATADICTFFPTPPAHGGVGCQ
jgi:hypothetical protein